MRLALKLLLLFSVAELWCGTGLHFTHGVLVSSTTRFQGFVSLDLAAGLNKYIQHETKRLEIIKTAKGYEDEVPLVEIRLQELQSLRQQMSADKAAGDSWPPSQHANDFHPTTALRLISRFLHTWDSKLKNDTLYGFRFAEFLSNDDHTKLPTETDRQLAARALVEIQHVYNLSTEHLYDGRVMGHQGMPLRPEDAYQVAVAADSLHHVQQAMQWFHTALRHTPSEQLTSSHVSNASYPVATAMATLGVLQYGMDKKAEGLELLEKASDLDPDDQDILRQFLSHRTGRNVEPLVHSDPGELRKQWFQLCANASSPAATLVQKRAKWYHVCRYRAARGVPYRRYREEVLSRSPFLSILHGFLSPAEAQRLVNVSATKLVDGAVIDGFKSDLVLVEGAVLNHTVEEARRLSVRISDVTGLDTGQGTSRPSGEPLHVYNYGMSGSFLPHYDINRVYKSRHIMRRSGHRMASVLIYLSEVKAGGATAFPYLNLTVVPEVGKALLWYNTNPSGSVEGDILHAGCTVAVGAKWVASMGIWSWGNELRRPCGPKVTSSHLAVDKISTQSPRMPKPNT